MPRKAPLRVVAADEPPARPLSVRAAADTGDPRSLLLAMRARVADAVGHPDTSPRDLAALTRRLQEIAKEINAIDAHEQGDEVGDAAATPDEELVI